MWFQYIIAGCTLINLAIVLLIRFNDLVHLPKSVDKIDKKVDNLEKKVDNINVNLTKIMAICEERHSQVVCKRK